MPLREHLEGLLARTKKPEKRAEYEAQLAMPPFPAAVAYLWDTFWRLRRRKGGGFGPAPIEWPDIAGFTAFTGVRLAPWEVEIIEDLDDCFMSSINGRDK